MEAHDSEDRKYAARVVRGRLYAGDTITQAEDQYVSWRAFKSEAGIKPEKPPPADYEPAGAPTPSLDALLAAETSEPEPTPGFFRRLFKRS
jgi:hypothetical protein